MPNKHKARNDKKPKKIPIIWGMALLNPYFTAVVDNIILFGPGVNAVTLANINTGNAK